MNARSLFERAAGPAPVEAPPKPGVKPGAPPTRPAPKHPNPFRRRLPGRDPGPMPKPKACVEDIGDAAKKARSLFKRPEKKGDPARALFKQFQNDPNLSKSLKSGAIKWCGSDPEPKAPPQQESAKSVIRSLR